MIKFTVFTILFLSCSTVGYNQILGGSAIDEGRKCLDTVDFKIADKFTGTVTVLVAIDRKGNVTGVTVQNNGTTISSTPSVVKAQNAARHLHFTPGDYYAKFQHALIQYNYVREDDEWSE